MDWQRLAEAVRRRRLSLDLNQEDVARAAKITPVTVSRIEGGASAKTRTLWKLDKALGWRSGSAEALVRDGTEPVVLPAGGEIYTDPDERKIWEITALPEERRREWIAQLRKTRNDHAREADGNDT